MNLLLRLFWTLLVSRTRGSLTMVDTCVTPFRVWFCDLDVLMHMNNGKYFSIMDLARTDLMIRSGSLSVLNKNGIYPVVASESMKFKKSLKLFQRFNIHTRVVGWDDRNFYLEQYFIRGKEIVSLAFIKAQFLYKKGGKVSTLEILRLLELSHLKMKTPKYMYDWKFNLEEGFKKNFN